MGTSLQTQGMNPGLMKIVADLAVQAKSEKYFFVGILPALGENYFVRSLLHGDGDFISAWPTRNIAQAVTDFLNANSKEFDPAGSPIDLAFQILKAIEAGRIILPHL